MIAMHISNRNTKESLGRPGKPGSFTEESSNDTCTVWKYRKQPDANIELRRCLLNMCEIRIIGSDEVWKITNAVTGMLQRDFKNIIGSLEVWFGL
jgi:hypothetical protein